MPVTKIRTMVVVDVEDQEYEVNIFLENFQNDVNPLNRGFVDSLNSLISWLDRENDAEEWTTRLGTANITFQSTRAENLHTIIDIRDTAINDGLRLTILQEALNGLRGIT